MPFLIRFQNTQYPGIYVGIEKTTLFVKHALIVANNLYDMTVMMDDTNIDSKWMFKKFWTMKDMPAGT